MYNLGMVMIGGSGASIRPSLFSTSVVDNFGLAGASLGQNAQAYYVNAKSDIAKFDSLVNRVARIANQTLRDQLVSDYGLNDPSNNNKALYMRNALASDVGNAEKFTPIAYEEGFPVRGPSRGRVSKLESFNNDLESAVKDAEITYGILPEPQIITKIVTVPGASTGGTNWTIPIVVAGGGIAVAALLGVFSGGK